MDSKFLDTDFDREDPRLVSVIDELPFWSAPFGLKLLAKIVPKKNMTVLDIGFGTGFPMLELAMRLGDTCKIYGIDPWNAGADRVREKIRVYGIDNCVVLPTVEAQNIAPLPDGNTNIPLPDQSIDLIVSNNGLNNVADLDKSLSECGRILKSGGQLVFTMNTNQSMMEFYRVMENVLAAHDLSDVISKMQRHIYEKRRPLEEVLALLHKYGFKEESVDHSQFSYTFTDGSAMFRHFFIRLGFLGAWEQVVPEGLREKIFSEIEIKLNEIAQGQGYIGLTIPFAVISAIFS